MDTFELGIEELDFSVRTYNALKRGGIHTVTELKKMSKEEVVDLPNVGKKTLEEIQNKLRELKLSDEEGVNSIPEEVVIREYFDSKPDRILSSILTECRVKGTDRISWKEFWKLREDCKPETKDQVIESLNNLVASGKIVIDNECVIPIAISIETYLQQLEDEKAKLYLDFLNGEKQIEIAKRKGVSQSQVNYAVSHYYSKMRREILDQFRFQEEEYLSLLSKYDLLDYDAEMYFGIPGITIRFIRHVFDQRGQDLEEALQDPSINDEIKGKIRKFLASREDKKITRRKEKIVIIDGVALYPARGILEDHILYRVGLDGLTYQSFVEKYNHCLETNRVPESMNLHLTNDLLLKRKYAMSDYCIWGRDGMIRYYDSSERDYSDLLRGLHLDLYQDIDVSAHMLFEEYPELMARYDIRDEYELFDMLDKLRCLVDAYIGDWNYDIDSLNPRIRNLMRHREFFNYQCSVAPFIRFGTKK